MEYRYVKDLAYILLVAALIVLGVLAFNHYKTEIDVTAKSVHADQEVDANLLQKAAEIEEGIRSRKNFIFSVYNDPLKQDIILPQKVDEIKLRLQKRYNQIRLYGVLKFDDEILVGIDHKNLEGQYKIGQKIKGSSIRIKSADPITQTAVLSNGKRLKVKERMNIFDLPSDKAAKDSKIQDSQNY